MTFKPTALGEKIARRLKAMGVDLVFDANQHSVQTDRETVQYNRRAGMDYPTWCLFDPFGPASLHMERDGERWVAQWSIASRLPATTCARSWEWDLEWHMTERVLLIWPKERDRR